MATPNQQKGLTPEPCVKMEVTEVPAIVGHNVANEMKMAKESDIAISNPNSCNSSRSNTPIEQIRHRLC